MLQVKRVTLIGITQAVEFDTVCGKWLVKNFTSGDIYVSLNEPLVEANAIKIASGYGQVITTNEHFAWSDDYKSKKIYVKGTGEIEVQQLCYH